VKEDVIDREPTIKLCENACLRPCTTVQYNTKAVVTTDGSTKLPNGLPKGYGEWPSSMWTTVKIEVLDRFVRTTTQQYAYGVKELVGELGGSWGLFLGLSFVSVLQMIEQLVCIVANSYLTNESGKETNEATGK
jgi:hypothetical protein